MENKMTDRKLWEAYWKNYKFTAIPQKPVYKNYILPKECHSFIEIGGFPGLNAGYFYKHVCTDVTLLDFYVDRQVIHRVERDNGIPTDSIKAIEADFFQFQADRTYDMVFSLGFIEHFQDTKDVIARHAALASPGGQLLIILPNLRGLNGLVQYVFDRPNLLIHNLKSMHLKHLKHICVELGLKDVRVEYTRKPMVWLEPKPGMSASVKKSVVKLLSCALKLFPIKCRLLSPYIIISATK